MKVLCPVCGVEGILEQRGNSSRVVHYEWVHGRRIFRKHTVKVNGNSSMGTMGTELGTEKSNTDCFNDNLGGRSLVWSRTSACHADDPGSNLGDRTTKSTWLLQLESFVYVLWS